MEVSGKVIDVKKESGTSKAGNEWEKKTFVIEFNEGTYTKHLAFELFGKERCAQYPFRKGQVVTVSFDIESTEWNGRWFTTLKSYRVAPFDPAAKPATKPAEPELAMNVQSQDEELPF